MINRCNIVVFDLETISADPYTTEPSEIAAVVVGPDLKLIKGASFNSGIIKPTNFDLIQQGALDVTGITREQLAEGIDQKIAVSSFVDFVKKYKSGNGKWDRPIPAGQNIINFDIPIMNRMFEKHKFTDTDGRPNVFHCRDFLDLLTFSWSWFYGRADVPKISMDAMRDYMGLKGEGSHRALKDVEDTAAILIKYLRLHQKLSNKVKFKDCFLGQDEV